ncbi:condensation domain-containing protein, partial [Kitasatospora sp. NPDC002040]|uniref:condensation domain-containing protein n=1 Tax=Kitasatospora sp. NPDC002040 TaxID=3154661 RepID=UPI003322BE0D
ALFDAPTVNGLAAVLEDASATRTPPQPTTRPAEIPLSLSQRRLWFLHQLDEEPTYNLAHAVRLTGPLDVDALKAALGDTVARHESLRTLFPNVDGRPLQKVLPADVQPPFIVTDAETENLDTLLSRAAEYRFDLATELPFRTSLISQGPQDHVLVLVLHHIACDGQSLPPLYRDIATAYAARLLGRAPDWTPLALQYVDWALWHREALGRAEDPDSGFADQLGYWKEQLEGLPGQLPLPFDRPRRAAPASPQGSVRFELPGELHGRLGAVARENRTTLFMLLQAGVAMLLSRLGAGTDIPLGSPASARQDDILQDLVGFFVNTLVLRIDTSGDPTFRELLLRVRETDLAAYARQDMPFDLIVEALNPERITGVNPLFQVNVGMQGTPDPVVSLSGVDSSPVPIKVQNAKFDLSFTFTNRSYDATQGDALDGVIDYRTDVFDRVAVEGIVARLVRVFEAVVADPDV